MKVGDIPKLQAPSPAAQEHSQLWSLDTACLTKRRLVRTIKNTLDNFTKTFHHQLIIELLNKLRLLPVKGKIESFRICKITAGIRRSTDEGEHWVRQKGEAFTEDLGGQELGICQWYDCKQICNVSWLLDPGKFKRSKRRDPPVTKDTPGYFPLGHREAFSCCT